METRRQRRRVLASEKKKEMRKIKRKAIQLIFPLGFYDNSCANEMKGSIIYKDRNENWNLSRADFISKSTAARTRGFQMVRNVSFLFSQEWKESTTSVDFPRAIFFYLLFSSLRMRSRVSFSSLWFTIIAWLLKEHLFFFFHRYYLRSLDVRRRFFIACNSLPV